MEDSWIVWNYDALYTYYKLSLLVKILSVFLVLWKGTIPFLIDSWLYDLPLLPLQNIPRCLPSLSSHQTSFRSGFCSRFPFLRTLIWWPAGIGIHTRFQLCFNFMLISWHFLVYIQFLGKLPGALKTRLKVTDCSKEQKLRTG